MKKMQYGVVNPKKLDYLLSMVLSIIAVSALWIGLWITLTQTIENAVSVLELMKKAFAFDLADVNYLVILIQSIIIYGTCSAFVTMLLIAIIKRRGRTVPGILSVLFGGLFFALEIGFLSEYANQLSVGVDGIYAIILGILAIALFIFIYKIFNCTCKLLLCKEKYDEYISGNAIKKDVEIANTGYIKNYKKISGLSSSEAVYDAIYSNDKEEAVVEKPKKEKKAKKAKENQKSQNIEVLEQQTGFGKANHFTFEQKLKMAKPVARQYFKEIKKYFEELGFKSNLTKSAETFTYKNTKYAIITTAGKSGLKIYFKLNPSNYENLTLPFTDASDKKKYEKTPLLFVVKSDLAVRRAKALMDDIKKALEDENK